MAPIALAAVPEVFVLEALRTPRALPGTSPAASGDEDLRLAGLAVQGILARSGIDPRWIDLALAAGAPAGVALERGLGRAGLAIIDLAADGCGLMAFQQGALAVLSGLHHLVLVAASGNGAANSDGWAEDHVVAARIATRAGIDPDAVSAWVECSQGRVLAARQERTWLAETVDLAGDFDDAPVQTAIPAPPCLGAAVLVLASAQAVRRFGLHARARVAGVWSAAADVGLAPLALVSAARAAMEAAGIAAAELHRVELDERWPAVTLAVARDLGLDLERVCPDGSGIATGRVVGAGGLARMVTLVHGLGRMDERFGLCVGGGLHGSAIAAVLDRAHYD